MAIHRRDKAKRKSACICFSGNWLRKLGTLRVNKTTKNTTVQSREHQHQVNCVMSLVLGQPL